MIWLMFLLGCQDAKPTDTRPEPTKDSQKTTKPKEKKALYTIDKQWIERAYDYSSKGSLNRILQNPPDIQNLAEELDQKNLPKLQKHPSYHQYRRILPKSGDSYINPKVRAQLLKLEDVQIYTRLTTLEKRTKYNALKKHKDLDLAKTPNLDKVKVALNLICWDTDSKKDIDLKESINEVCELWLVPHKQKENVVVNFDENNPIPYLENVYFLLPRKLDKEFKESLFVPIKKGKSKKLTESEKATEKALENRQSPSKKYSIALETIIPKSKENQKEEKKSTTTTSQVSYEACTKTKDEDEKEIRTTILNRTQEWSKTLKIDTKTTIDMEKHTITIDEKMSESECASLKLLYHAIPQALGCKPKLNQKIHNCGIK